MELNYDRISLKGWTYHLHIKNPRTRPDDWPITDPRAICFHLARDYYTKDSPDPADAWRWVSAYFWAHGASVDGREAWAYVNSSGKIHWPRVMNRLRLVDPEADRLTLPAWIFEDPEDYYYDHEHQYWTPDFD